MLSKLISMNLKTEKLVFLDREILYLNKENIVFVENKWITLLIDISISTCYLDLFGILRCFLVWKIVM